jgi:hypothetical protein
VQERPRRRTRETAAPPATWTAYAEYDRAFLGAPRWPYEGGIGRTTLVRCGVLWDAVALPLDVGLAALDTMQLSPDAGYSVLADYLRRELYVLVHPGTGVRCKGPGARVLTRGSWLLAPMGRHRFGSASAVWLSRPEDHGPLVDADDLAAALRGPEH